MATILVWKPYAYVLRAKLNHVGGETITDTTLSFSTVV